MSVTPAIDVANAATQAIINHLLLDAALFGTGKIQQPSLGSGYTGVYAKVVPPPDPDGNFKRDAEYPAIVVLPQGLVTEYTMQGGPNAVGFHGPIQVTVVTPGAESQSLAPLVDEMYAWLWKLNEPNNTIIDTITVMIGIDFPEYDVGSNVWTHLGARLYVTGRIE
jgi:hypothetical protein